jgi:hypothetical protein
MSALPGSETRLRRVLDGLLQALPWLLVVLLTALNLRFAIFMGPHDDAFITYRVARNLAAMFHPLLYPSVGGILRITQLQSYWAYRLEVDIQALPDPTLAPKEKVFGFVAEPNRFKSIDIPLYRTGIIEGAVLIQRAGGEQGVGGLRLTIQREGDPPLETIRTFSDGAYYAFGLLPGKYTLTVDPKQWEFMKAKATPEVLEFEIKALADGDYLEGLNVVLKTIEE